MFYFSKLILLHKCTLALLLSYVRDINAVLYVQETALNHVWMSGLLSDGFGATHGMMRNNLIWVVSRMQVLIDYYPIW